MIFGRNTLLLSALLVVASPTGVAAFAPLASSPHRSNTLASTASSAGQDGAGMRSFTLTPDQGNGTTMNPRYQIDKQSVYPPSMIERRTSSFSPASSASFRGTTLGQDQDGRMPFRSSPDFHMWDGTTGMSRRPIDPESSYPMGMMSFSRKTAAMSPSASLSSSRLPPRTGSKSLPSSFSSSSSSSSSLTTSSTTEASTISPQDMTKEQQWEYAAALRSRAGRNHMMWDGTTGMSREPINPSSSYPRGMRRGMW